MTMRRRLGRAIVACVTFVWLCSGLALGVDAVSRERHDSRERKPQRYYVLQVMGAAGEATFEVASDLEIKERLRDYEEEYKQAGMEWMKSKAEAKKRKEEFTQQPPKGPRLMRKMPSTYKKEEEARAYAEKMQKQWDEALEKKAAKKEGAAKEGEGEKKQE